MTHLGNIIARLLLEQPELSARTVSKRAGIDPSYFSKITKGNADASQEVLAKIALALGRTSAEKAEIIAAHMKDESCGYYPDFIRVIANGKFDPQTSDLHPDIEYLQKHFRNPGIQKAVRAIIELHRVGNTHGNSSKSDEKPQQKRTT